MLCAKNYISKDKEKYTSEKKKETLKEMKKKERLNNG